MVEAAWVTGAGAVCAQGASLPEIWRRMTEEDCLGPSSPGRLAGTTEGSLSYPAFSVPDTVFADGFRNSARDTLTLALRAGREALASAGLLEQDAAECAVCLGSTAGNALHFLGEYRDLKEVRPVITDGFADFFACSPAPALARELGLHGPALTVGNACCSGTDAVGLGLQWIRSGLCRRVLAGGADALSVIPYIGFRRLMIYSDEPCRPFDRARKGLNLGEGAGLLLLESPSAARERGVRPLAALRGYGAASDAHHLTAPHPEGAGLVRAVREALRTAGAAAEDVDFVNAHGTSTPDNDRVEGTTLKRLLPTAKLWASKGATGHTLGAAGGLEAALAVMALARQTLPASPGFADGDPDIGACPTRRTEECPLATALSTSLGFGGGNAALVFGKAD